MSLRQTSYFLPSHWYFRQWCACWLHTKASGKQSRFLNKNKSYFMHSRKCIVWGHAFFCLSVTLQDPTLTVYYCLCGFLTGNMNFFCLLSSLSLCTGLVLCEWGHALNDFLRSNNYIVLQPQLASVAHARSCDRRGTSGNHLYAFGMFENLGGLTTTLLLKASIWLVDLKISCSQPTCTITG